MSERPRATPEVNAIDNRGGRLTVQFHWLGDRYGHTISVVRGGVSRSLLESVEDHHESIWPPSPPFQNLSDCSIQSDFQCGQVTMLVGAAGKSHWAMTVSPSYHFGREEPQAFASELVFDVACRIKEPPQWLGSSYRTFGSQIAISEKRQSAIVLADAYSVAVIGESSNVELDATIGVLPTIRCVATATGSDCEPETVRWKYAIRLRGSGQCPE